MFDRLGGLSMKPSKLPGFAGHVVSWNEAHPAREGGMRYTEEIEDLCRSYLRLRHVALQIEQGLVATNFDTEVDCRALCQWIVKRLGVGLAEGKADDV